MTACSAGSVGTLPGASAPNNGGAVPARTHGKKLAVKLRITIPKRKHRHGKRGKYVSPATQSIAISITPNGGSPTTYNQNLTPASNPGCTASLISPTICVVTLALAPGSYTGTFTTYDGLLSGGNPTGNVLSAHQSAPFTVVTGKANAINVSLGGVPASVALITTDAALSGSDADGYTFDKCSQSAKVQVLGVDADRNFILGPGAPVPTLVQSSGTSFTIATPAPNSPNTFTLSHAVPGIASSAQLTATVTPVAGTGASVQNATVAFAFSSVICGLETSFTQGLAASSNITNIALGPDGNLWFTDGGTHITAIGKVTPSGAITEYTAGLSGSGPRGITSGPDGNVWMTEEYNGAIASVTPSGTITPFTLPGGSIPANIVAGPDGNLWYTDWASQYGVGMITTSGTATVYPNTAWTSDGDRVWGIAAGSDGNLWVTLQNSSQVCQITTAGVATCYSPAFAAGSSASPRQIVSGPDGNLWMIEFGANMIAKVSTAGVLLAEYPTNVPAAYGYPTFGPDGNFWFPDSVTTYSMTPSGVVNSTSYSRSNTVNAITVGPDGNLWIAGTGEIDRLF